MGQKIEILKHLTDVWRETQDIDAVLEFLTDDVEWHYSAVTKPPKHGKDGAREFLEAYKAKVRNPNWRIFNYAEKGDQLLVEGVDEFDLAEGGHAQIPYMGIYEFRGDKICSWRDYFDRGIADMSGDDTLPDYAKALIDKPAV